MVLPAPFGPEQADHLAALDLERQVLENLARFVALGEIQRPQDAHGLAGRRRDDDVHALRALLGGIRDDALRRARCI